MWSSLNKTTRRKIVRRQTSVSKVGFELTNTVFEHWKRVGNFLPLLGCTKIKNEVFWKLRPFVEPEDVVTALNKSQPQDTHELAEHLAHGTNFVNSNSIFIILLTNAYIQQYYITNAPTCLAFRGPYIVSIFLLIYFQQDATLHSLFISGKLLYMLRVVSSPIIRSTHNSICSIWYLSNSYCKYSCVCSWWWVEIPPETCRAVFQK